MKNLSVISGGLVLLGIGVCGHAQAINSQDDMHARVLDVYNFSPHMISAAQQQVKAQQMDAFWKDVKADPATTLPLLRGELKTESDPKFFEWDGSSLLLSMSHAPEDEAAAAKALSRTSMADVLPDKYFDMVHRLAVDGADTTDAAMHLLDAPGYKVSSPMWLNRGMAMVYLLLPREESKWVDAVVEQFASSKKDETKVTLLTVLFFAQMPQADAVIANAAHDASLSEAVRTEAQKWVKTAVDSRGVKYDVKGKEDDVRAMRRAAAGAVSEASLSQISVLTGKLVQLRGKK